MKGSMFLFLLAALLVVGFTWLRPTPPPADQTTPSPNAKQIARGKYLVTVAGCNDCHTPKLFSPKGMEFDNTRLLSGHPGGPKLPDAPAGLIAPEAWGSVTTNDFTAWVGPWGTSFTKNLTPDSATGLGSWTEKMFIKALRSGKDMGEGRPILPPMPWQNFAQMTDGDLRAIFAYLRSLPPVSNAVPDPLPPAGAPPKATK